MRKRFALLTVVLVAFVSFSSVAQGERRTSIDTENSSIHWKGKKVTGSHEGDISLKEGHLTFDGSSLKGGSFIVDMTSITVEDIENPNANAKLVRHLKNDDFFGTDVHKSAELVIKSVTKTGSEEGTGKATAIINYDVVGAFTIKGVTNEITFPVTLTDFGAAGMRANAEISIDRTLFGIHYGSDKSLGDKMIHKNFDLVVSIAAK